MKKTLLYLFCSLLFLVPVTVLAQTPVALGTTSPYVENFDGMTTTYPTGFVINLSATSTNIGTNATSLIFTPGATTAWNQTGNGVKNFASADALPSTASTTDQSSATNRALGVRQTSGTGYDPGTAFIFQATNTLGRKNLKLSFNLQSLDATSTRTTTWTIDYGIGANPTTFTPITNTTGTLTTGASTFSNYAVTADFGSALDNINDVVTIRIVTLTASGNPASGNRASSAIDDFSVSWSTNAATPTLTSTPTSLDFGTTQAVGTTSTSQNFTIGSSNLTAGATVTLTGSAYLISKDNVTFGSTPLTYTTTELATAATSKVYVQFKPTATGAATGSVKVSSSGATDATVSLTGTAVAAANPATLTVTPGTLAFGNQTVSQTSTPQFFNFTATNLSDVVTATASGPYLVSKDGIGFSNVVTYTTAEAALSPKVYVQFTPTALGAAPASTITISTATATAKTVTLTGTGVAATPPAGIANHVVISELFGGNGAAYNTDFIELYNPTSTDVDMSGWSVQYNSATGTGAFSGITVFPSGSIIKSHGYYLIQEQGTTPGTLTLPTADIATTGTTNNFNMSSSAGKVALVNNATLMTAAPTLPSASIVDFVAYGTTVTYSEGGTGATFAAPALTSTTSIERKAISTSTAATMAVGGSDDGKGNGYDSDVNSADFFVSTVINPQNSASSLESIPVPTYTATPATLTFSQNVNTTSAGVAVTLSGLGTLPATSVGTSGPYLISKTTTGGYTNTLSFTAAEMAATPKPVVYVQFTPTALGAANSNLYITGVGAVQQIIPLNGTGTAQPAPTLTVNPTTLTFTSIVGIAAAVQSYTLSGTNITQPTVVTTTGPYLVSKDGTTFTASVTFATNELNAAQTPKVYVQFIPTVVGANNGTVVQTTTGGSTVSTTVTLNGVGANAAPTMTAITDQSVCYTTTPQVIAINAISPVESGQTVVVSATNDNPGMFSQFGVLPLTATTAQINYTLASGASGTANVTLKLKDNGGVANGGVDTLVTKFKIVVNPLAVVTITSDAPGNLVEKGSTATLTASGGVSYAWTANATILSGLNSASIQIRPSVATTYTVTATNASGCTTVQTINVGVRAAVKLETSNVITPNGDGKNDVWVIRNIDLYPTNNVKVFDKAGKLVFSKSGYNNDWNGYYNGSPLTQGSYIYVVDLGSGQTYRGVLSIVRD